MHDSVNLTDPQKTLTTDILDRQHLQIKREQQDLWNAIDIGAGIDQITVCAEALFATAIEHFESEERAMYANRFTGLVAHRRFHTEMIKSLQELSGYLESRKITEATELLKFFELRLTYHLEYEDGAFERELSNNQIETVEAVADGSAALKLT